MHIIGIMMFIFLASFSGLQLALFVLVIMWAYPSIQCTMSTCTVVVFLWSDRAIEKSSRRAIDHDDNHV